MLRAQSSKSSRRPSDMVMPKGNCRGGVAMAKRADLASSRPRLTIMPSRSTGTKTGPRPFSMILRRMGM